MQWERDRIAEAGFDGCVTKPVDGAELRKRVRELLGVFEKEMKNERGGETAPAGDR
jgi:DNA-binding response OmpR family regulator